MVGQMYDALTRCITILFLIACAAVSVFIIAGMCDSVVHHATAAVGTWHQPSCSPTLTPSPSSSPSESPSITPSLLPSPSPSPMTVEALGPLHRAAPHRALGDTSGAREDSGQGWSLRVATPGPKPAPPPLRARTVRSRRVLVPEAAPGGAVRVTECGKRVAVRLSPALLLVALTLGTPLVLAGIISLGSAARYLLYRYHKWHIGGLVVRKWGGGQRRLMVDGAPV
jgi:hypothetical protein